MSNRPMTSARDALTDGGGVQEVWKARATSEQVDDILTLLTIRPTQCDSAILDAICRDWLDMHAAEHRLVARADAAERVIAAIRNYLATRQPADGSGA